MSDSDCYDLGFKIGSGEMVGKESAMDVDLCTEPDVAIEYMTGLSDGMKSQTTP